MPMTIVSRALVTLVAVALLAATPAGAQSSGDRAFTTLELQKQVRKRLVMLPFLSVFDNHAFSVQGSTVTLYGDVTRPSTKQAAGRRVDDLPGVARVVNNIQVLPLSSFDD